MLLHICSGSVGVKYSRGVTERLCRDVRQQYLIQTGLQTNLKTKGKKTHRAQEEEEEELLWRLCDRVQSRMLLLLSIFCLHKRKTVLFLLLLSRER